MHGETMTVYHLGNTQIDFSERVIIVAGNEFSIEPKANKLLQLLINNAHQVVTREEILEHVFPKQVVSYSSINRLIAILRKIFSHDPANTEYIKTISKVGYKLQVSVEPLTLMSDIENATQINSIQSDSNNQTTTLIDDLKSNKIYPLIFLITLTIFALYWFYPKSETTNKTLQCQQLSDWIHTGKNITDYYGCLDENMGFPAPSAYITNKIATPKGFTTLLQSGWLEEFRGKQVKLTMDVKANNIANYVGLFIRADGDSTDQDLAFINSAMADNLITESFDWKEHSLTINVPNETVTLVYGLYMDGAGEIWMDNVQLAVVGEAQLPVTQETLNLSPKNLTFEITTPKTKN